MFRTGEMIEGETWEHEIERRMQAIAWAVRSTVNSTAKMTPCQMALQRDMLTRAQVRVDWELIHEKRLSKAKKDNDRENKSRVDHEYMMKYHIIMVIISRLNKSY